MRRSMDPQIKGNVMKYKLVIFDTRLSCFETLLTTDRLIEAPNWHRNDTIFVNSDGLLFEINLNNPVLRLHNTGELTTLNNDHGISPEGMSLFLSNNDENGNSVIFQKDINTTNCIQITNNNPSWWHGVSPDGQTITYTALRERNFCICTFDLSTRKENILTNGFEHTDGPDFSADGRWIWFNGERGGEMNLWRMHPDGTRLSQMTSGPTVDWFPHPSPSDDAVLYMSYAPGTKGHPRQKHVELKLLNLRNRKITVIKKIFGGQGSINVPCWDPKGHRFAYVELQS